MPWFRVDDNFAFHRKAVRASNAALGLWVRAGAWAMAQLTDGEIPAEIVRMLGTEKQAEQLVACGLWERTRAGWRFHEWAEWQPSKAKLESERAATRERVARARDTARARRDRADAAPTSRGDRAEASTTRNTPSGRHV